MAEERLARLRRGATLEQVYAPRATIPINHIDSAFQSQEYIAHLILQDPHDVQRIVALPKTSPDDDKPSVDQGSWLFEQLRRLAQDLTYPLITNLQLECTRDTCPEMKAGEWLYLCVAHGNNVGGHVQCCAIDYIVHTLDSATALLNSTRVFPSRLSVPPSSYRHFSSLARRLSRIFAHAFYHHRELFSQAEAESSLYARFLALSQQNSLVPPELLVIPLEGLQPNHSHEQEGLVEDEHSSNSPRTTTDTSNEGSYSPDTMHDRPPQSRQLYDHGSANEVVHNSHDDDPEEMDLPEEPEVASESQTDAHGFPEPTAESHAANLAPQDSEANRTQDLPHPSEELPSDGKMALESGFEAKPVLSNDDPKPSDETERRIEQSQDREEDVRPVSPSENEALIQEDKVDSERKDS